MELWFLTCQTRCNKDGAAAPIDEFKTSVPTKEKSASEDSKTETKSKDEPDEVDEDDETDDGKAPKAPKTPAKEENSFSVTLHHEDDSDVSQSLLWS